jgi:beta-glucosidase
MSASDLLLSRLTKTKDGREGLTMRVYLDPPEKTGREKIDEIYMSKSGCLLIDYKIPKHPSTLYWLKL